MAPKQMTLATEADAGFALHRKATKRYVFLAEMDQVMPWAKLCAVIESYYPKEPAQGEGWAASIGLEQMLRHGKVKAIADPELSELYEQYEHIKASIRAKVEHPFRVIKWQFGYRKVRYRGLAKNGAQVMTLFALANLGWHDEVCWPRQDRCVRSAWNGTAERRKATETNIRAAKKPSQKRHRVPFTQHCTR